ncbi:MAG: prepilin-type N-terminal cleavage/methylation domain-containing protein [Alphaproteobacteria bacterium]|jgi:prepilin-type N-terminal cleavage/methylation domain-containing protein|nr:prepilin-type N-terminal cleavage/methylation domain-containing protein [Alphaproteobacteria bacterium]MDP6814057.1 prepilin-type N-terminal cleavage/methylation domain-containing protein [Alphaproteobacteria bacterium]
MRHRKTVARETTGTWPSRLGGEAGFTLLELLVASLLALILLLTTTTFFFQSIEFADQQRVRSVLNAQARAAFDMLGDGAVLDPTDASTYVHGFRNSTNILGEDNGDFLRQHDYDSNASLDDVHYLSFAQDFDGAEVTDRIVGNRFSPHTVNCDGVDDPVDGCTANGTVDSRGFLARAPRLYLDGTGTVYSPAVNSDRSIDDADRDNANLTEEVEIRLTTPHNLNRQRFRTDDVSESYRTIFSTLRRPQDDP